MKNFTRKIKTFLKQADLKPAELAESIGMKKSTLACWLTGARTASPESIVDFTGRMKAFQITVNAASAALDNFFVEV